MKFTFSVCLIEVIVTLVKFLKLNLTVLENFVNNYDVNFKHNSFY